MKPKASLFWLRVISRASLLVSAEEKHHRFLRGIGELSPPWCGLKGQPLPPTPKFGGNVSATGTVTKWFGGAVRRGHVSYRYRNLLEDSGGSDDRLTLVFNPGKVDLAHFIQSVIPKFISAFDGYFAELFNEELIDTMPGTETKGARFRPPWISPVSFFDETLCKRAFGLPPVGVADRIRDLVEEACVMENGIYIVASSKALLVKDSMEVI